MKEIIRLSIKEFLKDKERNVNTSNNGWRRFKIMLAVAFLLSSIVYYFVHLWPPLLSLAIFLLCITSILYAEVKLYKLYLKLFK